MAKKNKKKKPPEQRNPNATVLRNPLFGKARIIPKKEPKPPSENEEW